MIASNFEEFVEKFEQAERVALNNKFGQELTTRLLESKLTENPNMTEEEWKEVKSQFMTFLFVQIVQENSDLMNELASHIYNK